MDLNEIFKATMVLFAIIDIIGSVPLIIKIKDDNGGDIHAPYITLISTIILIVFLIMGESILMLFGVNIESFAIAGAIILYAMAFEMVMGLKLIRNDNSNISKGKMAGIVPLAFPLIAGAGVMTTLVTLRAEYEMINIIVAIIINMIVVFLVLNSTNRIERFLGKGGIAILQKVFGIILLAIATKLFFSNLAILIS